MLMALTCSGSADSANKSTRDLFITADYAYRLNPSQQTRLNSIDKIRTPIFQVRGKSLNQS